MTGPAAVARDRFVLCCVRCTRETQGFAVRCPSCEGLIDVHYRLGDSPAERGPDGDAISRYGALLPVTQASSYRLGLPATPLIELEPTDGMRVFCKVEGVLPTGSTKDRLAAVALPYMLESGVRRFAFSSTGNTAIAYAHGLHAYPELEARLYLAPDVDRSRVGPVPPNLSIVVVNGDYAEASAMARADAHRTGFTPEGGFFNVGRREGAKLAYLEAVDQLGSLGLTPGAIVQAVASGLGIYAAARAMAEIRAGGRSGVAPRFFCAQQDSCAPMALAYTAEQKGRPARRVLRNPKGIAPALLLGDPFASYSYVADAVRTSGGDFLTVTNAEVSHTLTSQPEMPVPLGPSAAVALAAAPKIAPRVNLRAEEALLVMLTGGPDR